MVVGHHDLIRIEIQVPLITIVCLDVEVGCLQTTGGTGRTMDGETPQAKAAHFHLGTTHNCLHLGL